MEKFQGWLALVAGTVVFSKWPILYRIVAIPLHAQSVRQYIFCRYIDSDSKPGHPGVVYYSDLFPYDYTDTMKLSFYAQGETFAFFDYLHMQYGAVKKDKFTRAECVGKLTSNPPSEKAAREDMNRHVAFDKSGGYSDVIMTQWHPADQTILQPPQQLPTHGATAN